MINWEGEIPAVIRKRLTAESKRWKNSCQEVHIRGGVNECQVIFTQVQFPIGWIHQLWCQVLDIHRMSEINFLEDFLRKSHPMLWKICQQMDRQRPVELFIDRGMWSRWIFPWLVESSSFQPAIIPRVEINISEYYPFRGPCSIFIGGNHKTRGTPYLDVLCPKNNTMKFYQQVTNGCLCCQSLTCSSRWYPQIHLYMLLLEINQNLDLRSRMRDRDMADRVVHWWTPWYKGRPEDQQRMLWACYVPEELRIRDFL